MDDHIKNDDLQTLTFTKKNLDHYKWWVIWTNLKKYLIYGKLSLYLIIRIKNNEFSNLITHTRFGLNFNSNTVTISEAVLTEYIKVKFIFTVYCIISYRHKIFLFLVLYTYLFFYRVSGVKPYCKNVLEHYRTLREIFNTTIISDHLRFSSN